MTSTGRLRALRCPPGTWTGLFLPVEDFYFTGRWVRSYVPVSFQAVTTDVTRLDAKNYREFQNEHADRLVQGGSPCTYFYALDYRKITDKAIQ